MIFKLIVFRLAEQWKTGIFKRGGKGVLGEAGQAGINQAAKLAGD